MYGLERIANKLLLASKIFSFGIAIMIWYNLYSLVSFISFGQYVIVTLATLVVIPISAKLQTIKKNIEIEYNWTMIANEPVEPAELAEPVELIEEFKNIEVETEEEFCIVDEIAIEPEEEFCIIEKVEPVIGKMAKFEIIEEYML